MESAHRYFRIGAPLILEWTHQSTGICNSDTVAFHTPSICLEMQGIRIEIHEQAGADVIRDTLLALRQLC